VIVRHCHAGCLLLLLLQLEREVRRRRREWLCRGWRRRPVHVLVAAQEREWDRERRRRHLNLMMIMMWLRRRRPWWRWHRQGGGGCRGAARAREALHDGHELAGFRVHDLGRHRVDDDRLAHLLDGSSSSSRLRRRGLPDLVGVLADLERRRARTLQLQLPALRRRR